MPIFVEDAWWGYIGFDHCDEDRLWPDAEIEALTGTASTLGAAIERERAVGRLDEAQALYRTLIEQMPAVTYIEELGTGDETYSSPQTQSLLGYAADEWGPHEKWCRRRSTRRTASGWSTRGRKPTRRASPAAEYRMLTK